MESSWRGAGPYHGGTGPLTVTPVDNRHLLGEPIRRAVVAAGFEESADLSGDKQEGYARAEVTVDRRGRRASTSRAYLKPAKEAMRKVCQQRFEEFGAEGWAGKIKPLSTAKMAKRYESGELTIKIDKSLQPA
eukprot:gene23965-24026_t